MHHMHKFVHTNVSMCNKNTKTQFIYVNECKQMTPKKIQREVEKCTMHLCEICIFWG